MSLHRSSSALGIVLARSDLCSSWHLDCQRSGESNLRGNLGRDPAGVQVWISRLRPGQRKPMCLEDPHVDSERSMRPANCAYVRTRTSNSPAFALTALSSVTVTHSRGSRCCVSRS